jgi:hypothetical protein
VHRGTACSRIKVHLTSPGAVTYWPTVQIDGTEGLVRSAALMPNESALGQRLTIAY